MKILYGVVGEGMGHAIRSRVILDRLIADGHEVVIVASSRAHTYLSEHFENVREIWGLSMVTAENRVQKWKTALGLIRGANTGWPDNLRAMWDMARDFGPEVVVTDFETWAALYGHDRRIPVICLDNIQAVRRLDHPPSITAGKEAQWALAKSVIKAKIPTADRYLITSFFDGPVMRKRTRVVPPILRPMILDAKPTPGDHILVYQTAASFPELPQVLAGFHDTEFRMYGRWEESQCPEAPNLSFRPFSEQGFVDDLASCRGVIASAGFTLISEALHLGKPYLATPVEGQFEQVMNARYIEHLGYGLAAEGFDAELVAGFLRRIDEFARSLGYYPRSGNEPVFEALTEALDSAAAGLL
jgi:uncharacterized protein (TIGR00661 family)